MSEEKLFSFYCQVCNGLSMEKNYRSKQKSQNHRHKGKTRAPQKVPKANMFGTHAVREAWLNPVRSINALYLTQQAFSDFEDTLHEARKKNLKRPDPVRVEKDLIDKIVSKGAVHQGIALSCGPLEEYDVQDLMIKSHNQDRTVLAILDQVTDPHNVGAILRSASAFGIDGIIMQKKHAPSLEGVLAKTACGAVDNIPVASAVNLSREIKALQNDGFFVFGFDEHSDVSIKTMDIPDKCVIVLGSEGNGIRHLIKESCDQLVKLPTQGRIGSLNVSNAAAIGFYVLGRD